MTTWHHAPVSDFDRLGEDELRARRTHKWHAFAADVLPMDLAELDVPTAPCVVEAIRGAVDVECFGYPMFADTTLAEATASFGVPGATAGPPIRRGCTTSPTCCAASRSPSPSSAVTVTWCCRHRRTRRSST